MRNARRHLYSNSFFPLIYFWKSLFMLMFTIEFPAIPRATLPCSCPVQRHHRGHHPHPHHSAWPSNPIKTPFLFLKTDSNLPALRLCIVPVCVIGIMDVKLTCCVTTTLPLFMSQIIFSSFKMMHLINYPWCWYTSMQLHWQQKLQKC